MMLYSSQYRDEKSEEEIPVVKINHLSHSVTNCITNGQWLNDVEILAAQYYLIEEDKDLLPFGGLQMQYWDRD